VDVGPYARLYLFTDGVFEIEKPDGSMWNYQEFVKYFTALSPEDAPMDRLLAHVRRLHAAETLADDFSVVEVRF
jgi:sigma-B regulation protein RsbU (phosphoserine phosphatase)